MRQLGVPAPFAEEHAGIKGFGEVGELEELVDSVGFLGREEVFVGEAGAEGEVEVAGAGVVGLVLGFLVVH